MTLERTAELLDEALKCVISGDRVFPEDIASYKQAREAVKLLLAVAEAECKSWEDSLQFAPRVEALLAFEARLGDGQ